MLKNALITSDGITRRIAGIKFGAKPLLIMIFKEIEHISTNAVDCLPAMRQLCRRHIMTLNAAQRVVKINLVIQIIKVAIFYKVTI